MVFTKEVYTVVEGEDTHVEVCIGLNGSLSLDSSSANGTFSIATAAVSGVSARLTPFMQ